MHKTFAGLDFTLTSEYRVMSFTKATMGSVDDTVLIINSAEKIIILQ